MTNASHTFWVTSKIKESLNRVLFHQHDKIPLFITRAYKVIATLSNKKQATTRLL